MTRRVLVTGGAGFLGYHLARHLADDGAHVTLLDDLSRGERDPDLETLLDRPIVRLVTGDLREASTLDDLEPGFDAVYHLAAVIGVENVLERPAEVIHTNTLATLNVLDWFRDGGADALLFASTSEAYAWTRDFHELPIPTPEDVPLALTDLDNHRASYAGSKIWGELATRQYARAADKPAVIVRPHNVFGPRMGFSHVMPELFRRAWEGEDPLTVYSVDHRRAFCYVDDAVRCMVDAVRTPAAHGETLNVGNDRTEVRIGDLARRILDHVDADPEIRPAEPESDPIERRCPDLSKARRLLDYEPRIPLDEGLERTLDWYRDALARRREVSP